MYRFLTIWTIISCFAFSSVNSSQYFNIEPEWFFDIKGSNSGHTVLPFLTLPVGGSGLSRGISIPGMMDASDILSVAANTAFFPYYAFSVNHLEWLMGLRREYTAAAFPVLDVGTFGAYSEVFTIGGISRAFDINEYPYKPVVADYSAALSFSRQLIPKRLAVGFVASYVGSYLDGQSSGTSSFNASISAFPFSQLHLGFYVKNISPGIKYGTLYEPLPLQSGLAILVKPLGNAADRAGRFYFDLAAGIQKTADEPLAAATSVEIIPSVQLLKLRTGYNYTVGQSDVLEGLGAGFGLSYQNTHFDFGWRYCSAVFGQVWNIGISTHLDEILPKNAEDFYKTAEKSFRKGKYDRCILYAQRALSLDPNMWKAHAIIAKANAQLRRKHGTEIALIYTANVKGSFVATSGATSSAGGLARQATAIIELRNQFPLSITVEAGNFVEPTTHPIKAKLADWYQGYVKFDAYAAASSEIDYGVENIVERARNSKAPLIISNFRNPPSSKIVNSKVIKQGKFSFAFLSAVGPSRSNIYRNRANLEPVVEKINTLMMYKELRRCNIRVLCVDDTWENIRHYARSIENIDIIICNSLKQCFFNPVKEGRTIILSAGESGEYVGRLIIRFDEKGSMTSYENGLIRLDEKISFEPEVANKLKRIALKAELEEHTTADLLMRKGKLDGVFVFTSDRDLVSHPYIKIMARMAEFPLVESRFGCIKPQISFACQKSAFAILDSAKTARWVGVAELGELSYKQFDIDTGLEILEIRFLPDGEWIYYVGSHVVKKDADIYRIKSSGANNMPLLCWPGSSEQDIEISNDGTQLAFSSNRDGKFQVFICDTSGNSAISIEHQRANQIKPRFSPDGKRLAYLCDLLNVSNRHDIWVYNLENGEITNVTTNSKVNDYCWLDDSKSIVYSAGIDRYRLNKVSIEKKENLTLLTSDTTQNCSDISPQFIYFRGKPQIIFTRLYDSGERQIYCVSPDGSNLRRIVNSKGNDWLQ